MGPQAKRSLSLCCSVCLSPRESLLAEMGVSIKEDGGTLGVFSPKGVSAPPSRTPRVLRTGSSWRQNVEKTGFMWLSKFLGKLGKY